MRPADMGIGAEFHTLGLHLPHTALYDLFLELEIRDAIAQQATDTVLFFIHDNIVAGTRQLLPGGHSGRPGTHHRDPLAGLVGGDLWLIQPSAQAFSTIESSMFLIVTGASSMLSVHEARTARGRCGR